MRIDGIVGTGSGTYVTLVRTRKQHNVSGVFQADAPGSRKAVMRAKRLDPATQPGAPFGGRSSWA